MELMLVTVGMFVFNSFHGFWETLFWIPYLCPNYSRCWRMLGYSHGCGCMLGLPWATQIDWMPDIEQLHLFHSDLQSTMSGFEYIPCWFPRKRTQDPKVAAWNMFFPFLSPANSWCFRSHVGRVQPWNWIRNHKCKSRFPKLGPVAQDTSQLDMQSLVEAPWSLETGHFSKLSH